VTARIPEGEIAAPSNFIRDIIREDLAAGKHQRVVTRFPPEPNGYLHIGHAKSICLNFGLARDFKGVCHLRFDDTNPEAEDMEYVESIQRDVRWLGFDWDDKLFYASDYYERLHQYARELIQKGKAYVCNLSEDEFRLVRGTITEPGRPSPYRDRPVEESLDLFARMRAGEFDEGSCVVRAKIDMASPNMKLRDPPIYRIKKTPHYRTGDAWCIYPLYDFAHALSDAIERITHSICTLEFENNRDLYDWFVDNLDVPARPRQYEFARLNLTYTVMSKRKLLELVKGGFVKGWDDPRMPTIAGLRRRGITPEAIRAFCEEIGVAKANSTVEIAKFESCVRDDLNLRAPRVMAVLRPLKVVIDNWPEGRIDELDAPYFPDDVGKEGSRKVPFGRELYIERDDFAEEAPPKWHRLAPGREVRLRYAYIITCNEVIKDPKTGEVVELRCTYDPKSRGGDAEGGRKVKGTLHWVSAERALDAELRVYDRLFLSEKPDVVEEGRDFKENLNPDSLVVLPCCKLEPSLATAAPGSHFQFERQGFFFADPIDSKAGAPVFNRTVSLKDSWAKIAEKKPEAPTEKPKAADEARAKAPARPSFDERFARLSGEAAKRVDALASAGLGREDALLLVEEGESVVGLFEEAVKAHKNPKGIAKLIINEVLRERKERKVEALPFGGVELGELVALIDEGTITATIAKEVLAEMLKKGGRPRAIVEQKGMKQVADAGALEPIVDQVIAAHPDEVSRYRGGNKNLMGFFVGKVMKSSGGKANAKLVGDLLARKLD